jgi:hypothetical protein
MVEVLEKTGVFEETYDQEVFGVVVMVVEAFAVEVFVP